MGADKATMLVDGRILAERARNALRASGVTAPVLAIGGHRAPLESAGFTWVPDGWPGEGPLGGVITALRAVDERVGVPITVVLACDLLAPVAGIVRDLVGALDDGHDAAVPAVDGRIQWLHAAWHARSRPTLEAAFSSGIRAPRHALDRSRLAVIDVDDPDVERDADTPDDLARPGSRRSPASDTYSAGVDIPEIDVATLADKQRDGAPVVDVRQPDEYEEAHVPGVALIPLGELPDRVGEVPTDGTVYVICKSGGRSAKAVEYLRANGIDAVNVAGGTMAWISAEYPVETGA